MEIVQGEYYKTRDGRKVGPMNRWSENSDNCFEDENENIYRPDGISDYGGPTLISLWSEAPTSPVREVTKREIVPGQYGRVIVGTTVFFANLSDAEERKVPIELHDDLSATELRAAAAVLLEIAGALE